VLLCGAAPRRARAHAHTCADAARSRLPAACPPALCRGAHRQAAEVMAKFFERCAGEPAYWDKISAGGLDRIYSR
jgi:hypothetical protein